MCDPTVESFKPRPPEAPQTERRNCTGRIWMQSCAVLSQRAMRQPSISASVCCHLSRIDVDTTLWWSELHLLHINPDLRTRRDSLNTPTRGGLASPSNRAAWGCIAKWMHRHTHTHTWAQWTNVTHSLIYGHEGRECVRKNKCKMIQKQESKKERKEKKRREKGS